jgi:hypothetical protein
MRTIPQVSSSLGKKKSGKWQPSEKEEKNHRGAEVGIISGLAVRGKGCCRCAIVNDG